MSALDRQVQAIVRDSTKMQRASERHLANAQALVERLQTCRNCGFTYEQHDQVDGRCPDPDGVL